MNESLPVERSLVRRPREGKGRGTLMQGNISLLVAFKKIDYEVAPMISNHFLLPQPTAGGRGGGGSEAQAEFSGLKKKSLPWTISLSQD